MLIVSWNVAGLSTTVQRIHESYASSASSSSSSQKKNGSATAAIRSYLERHQADILCVQEHKIPLPQLSSRTEPKGCAVVEGYESFWSCCTDSKARGMNGVVTYVKQGLVVSANSRPVGCLDSHGRCVLTDHGTFCIFNVYVPASGGTPMAVKMEFLKALRRAMQEQRKLGKKVLLVGDLNITHTRLDVYWSDRVIYVDEIIEQHQQQVETKNSNHEQDAIPWKRQLIQAWPRLKAALETKHVVETKTTNSRTNQTFDKFRLAVTVENNKKVFLGKHESCAEHCLHAYDTSAWSYTDKETGEEIVAQEANVVRVGVLVELMSKIEGVDWDQATQREIAEEATVSRASPPIKWLNQLLKEDDMVDPFRELQGPAQGRFTCWHQFTNKRYNNEGIRLDYTLVDRSLLSLVQKGSPLKSFDNYDPLSEEAALACATEDGRYQPVSFEGGGLPEVSRDTLDRQFVPPHTGMIYTPPSFSDHIAVSILFEDSIRPKVELDKSDSNTKKAQPHKAQPSIASFFGGTNKTGKRKTPASSMAALKSKQPARKIPAHSILHHFAKKK